MIFFLSALCIFIIYGRMLNEDVNLKMAYPLKILQRGRWIQKKIHMLSHVVKDKLRPIKIFKSLFVQKSIQIGQHPIQQIERSSEEPYKMKDFHRETGAGTRKLYEAKKPVSCCQISFLEEMAGVCQADCLTSAEQEIPD